MFRLVNNCRSCAKAAIWVTLVFGLFLQSSGCRSLTSQSKPTPPPVSPVAFPTQPLPVTITSVRPQPGSPNSFRPPSFQKLVDSSKSQPEKITVSRPVTPETVVVKKEILPPKNTSVPVVTEKPNTEEVEALKRRVSELENKLAESKAKAESAKIEDAFMVSKPVALQPKPPRRVPTFNDPGVTVSSDAERIRIEVTDKTLFIPGTWKLNPEAEDLLRKIAGEIRAGDPEASLEIEGHTDCINTDPSNTMQKHDVASVKAMGVMEYFIKTLRWNPEKIRPTSFGASRPVADNGTPEGRIRNNRIEIVVLPTK